MLDQSKKDSCIPCGLHTPSRNTYFDGKLLTSRDFQAEQDYGRGLRQMHNALLHGTGVVCGLELVEHPTASCQDKFVVLQPGMALDCCGQEIIVPEPVLVKVADMIADDDALADELTGDKHLFIAIKRCDTGAEPLPVLLPGCDGESGATEHGRILEGYEMVLFARDPLSVAPQNLPTDPNFAWVHSIPMEAKTPGAITLNAVENWTLIGSQAQDDTSRINIHRADNLDLIAQLNGPEVVGDIVVSNSLGMIFVSGLRFGDGSSGIGVWSLVDITTAPDPAFVIKLGERVPARMTLSPVSGTLFVLNQHLNTRVEVLSFAAGAIESDRDGVTPGHRLELRGINFADEEGSFTRQAAMFEMSPDGRFLAMAASDLRSDTGLFIIDVAQFVAGNINSPDDARPARLGIGREERAHLVGWSLDSAILYVGTQDDDFARIHRFALTGEKNNVEPRGRGVRYAGMILDLAIAPTETQAYLLMTDAEKRTRFVATSTELIKDLTSEDPLEPPMPDSAIRIDGNGLNMALNQQGDRLYVAAADAAPSDQPDRGLIAVIDIAEAQCDAIFATATEDCATCADRSIDTPDHAVILGHIPGYVAGAEQRMRDAGNANIDSGDVSLDNALFRSIVPSSAKIKEVIECMLSRGIAEGPPGPRGEPGLQGAPGVPGRDGRNGVDGRDGVDGQDGADGRDGVDGQDGQDGTSIPVNAITGLSWQHNAVLSATESQDFIKNMSEVGLAMQFRKPVRFDQFTGSQRAGQTMVIELQKRTEASLGTPGRSGLTVWATVRSMQVAPIENIDPSGADRITSWDVLPSAGEVEGIALLVNQDEDDNGEMIAPGDMLRVVFYTDFILDVDGHMLDGTHMGGKVPTGNGIPGSTFRSWFQLT